MQEEFLKACRREEVEFTPVWLMRQAGRFLPEYMSIRSNHSFLEMCKTPDLATQVTLQPVDRFGMDAAILFADILLPLEGMGIDLEFAKDEGPVIHNPVRSQKDVDALKIMDAEEATPYVMEAVRQLRHELVGKVPLIGFSGAPFTLASYIIEGGGSKTYLNCKRMMYAAPTVWHALMQKISEVILRYLKAQIKAGAQAVQVFDSWVGCLAPDDYKEYVLPYSKYVMDGLKDQGVPVIHFANNGSTLLEMVKQAGGDVIGLDWRCELDSAWQRLGYDVAVQGNLDPFALFAPPAVIEGKVKRILAQAAKRPGHIFNLGHGIHKETPLEHVQVLVDAVHKYSRLSLSQLLED
ncbi:MAG: uroporphyrinogen decarboxylase [Peptococcaceae bacterium]|nr:uroporphyrinogen decarboxylase [Peptococcaceae bacterium]